MSESMKKPDSEVDSDPTIVAPPINPIKDGSRGPKRIVETEVVGSKKQKIINGDVQQAVENKKFETETQEVAKEEQTSSSEEQNKVEVPPTIMSAATTQDAQRGSSSNDAEEDNNSEKEADEHLETTKKCVEVSPTIKSAATTQDAKRASSSNESEENDGNDNSDDQHLQTPKKSDTDVQMFDASALKKTTPQTPITSQATGSKTLFMSNLSLSIEEEDVKTFFKNVGEIVEVHLNMKEDRFAGHGHIEFTTAEAAQEALKLNNELLLDHPVRLDLAMERGGHRHPTTTSHATGSKTLYLGNLSFSIEEDDVRDFFKDVGEIAEIRFAIRDDKFLGYGHVEFTTAEAAQEALKLNNEVILDRQVKLDLARERGAYTPGSSMEKSNQKGGQAQGKTVFVRGFDSSDGFDKIRSDLEKHFGKCGEISRMSIPKDHESGAPKGVAFIDFVDSNGFNQALELDGSEVGGSTITVEEAKKHRGDGRERSGHGGRGWGGGTGYGGGWAGGNGYVSGRGGGSGSGGGWAGGSGSGSGRAGEYGSVGGQGGGSGSGGGWGRESGTGGGWASGSSYFRGWGRESGSGSDRVRVCGSGGGRGIESGSGSSRGRDSGCVSGRSSGSGYGGGWGRESGSRGGWGRESGSRCGWGRESGSGSSRGRESGSGGGWGRESGTRGGWGRESGSGSSRGRESGSGGGWGGESGRTGSEYSSSRVGRFSGSHGSNSRGPSRP